MLRCFYAMPLKFFVMKKETKGKASKKFWELESHILAIIKQLIPYDFEIILQRFLKCQIY